MSSLSELPLRSFQKLAILDQTYGLPGYIKSATEADFETTRGPFGDPVRKLYPCHTPAATWLSLTEYAEKAAEGRSFAVEAELRKACYFHGIVGDVQPILHQIENPPQEKEAESDDQYLYVSEDRTSRRGPLHTPELTKQAASWLVDNAHNLSLADRSTAANRLLAAARAYQLPSLSDNLQTQIAIEKMGSCRRMPTIDSATQTLQCRRRAAERMGKKEAADTLREMESVVAAFRGPYLPEKVGLAVLEAASQADQQLGIWHNPKATYGVSTLPELSLFTNCPAIEKAAADATWLLVGTSLKFDKKAVEQLAELPGEVEKSAGESDLFSQLIADSPLDRLNKRASTPEGREEVLAYLSQQGIAPINQKAACFDPATLQSLQAEYESTRH